jgi:hypothetical protein
MHSKYNHISGRRQPFKRNQVNRFCRYFGDFPPRNSSPAFRVFSCRHRNYVERAGLFRETKRGRELSVDITGLLYQNVSVDGSCKGDQRIT